MRVCFLLPGNFISGGVFVINEHARRLAAMGHEVTIAYQNDATPLEITVYPGMNGVRTAHLSRLPQGEPYDFAIATWWESVYALKGIRARRYGYFIQDREAEFYFKPERVNRAFVELTYEADLVPFVVTRSLQGFMAERGKEATLVPYALDLERFGPERAEIPRGDRLRVLVEGAASNERKQIPKSFEVLKRFPEVEVFYLTADGVRDPAWKIDRLFERIPYPRVPGIYASCDLILKLSSMESFAFPVAEMFASGGTAIVSDFPGHDEYIRHGENALVVSGGDIDGASAALRSLIQDRALLEKLRREARVTSRKFSWESSSAAFEAGLKAAAQDPTRGTGRMDSIERHRVAFEDLRVLNDEWRRFRNEAQELRGRLSQLEHELRCMQVSPAWRMGRTLTWPVRKLRQLRAGS